MWDERYATTAYVYGTAPNDFFASSIENMKPGALLLPGEGEGRNAVHALKLGWSVRAFDQSVEGKKKAMKLAGELKPVFRYDVCDLQEFHFKKESYDAVALIFFHVPPPLRSFLHVQSIEALKPGGNLILQAFHTTQLGKGTGGPQDADMLMNKAMLEKDFSSLETRVLEERSILIQEGPYHQGEANVINYIGHKNQ
jgi:hypothetical protein